MTCNEFAAQLTPYLNGSLTTDEAEALELHAAECSACEDMMNRATVRSVDAFAPPLPPKLRATTLSAVANVSRGGMSTRWLRIAGVAAAAALVFVVARPREKGAQNIRPDSTLASAARRGDSTREQMSTPSDRAASEFRAIDDAARELEAALQKSPGDTELRAFLSSVTSQRSELERRVKDARS